MTESHSIASAIADALDWWREAGVDCDFVDAPQDWLAAANPSEPPKPIARPAEPDAPPPPMAGGPRESWPAELADFPAWWLSEPSLALSGFARVPPRGAAGADLMVLVAMPEADDGERLLSGRAGRMLDAMFAAMGLSEDRVYVASALPARVAMPDWAGLAQQGFGAVLAHHVALAKPRKLLVFGKTGVSTLLGNDSPQTLSVLPDLNHELGSVPSITTYDLEAILAKPGFKANLWNRWLDWTGIK